MDREKEEKVKKVEEERQDLGRELRYTQQVVAGELAGWQEWHAKVARRAVRDLVRNMVVGERARLESMKRAMRKLKLPSADIAMRSTTETNSETLTDADGEASSAGDVVDNEPSIV